MAGQDTHGVAELAGPPDLDLPGVARLAVRVGLDEVQGVRGPVRDVVAVDGRGPGDDLHVDVGRLEPVEEDVGVDREGLAHLRAVRDTARLDVVDRDARPGLPDPCLVLREITRPGAVVTHDRGVGPSGRGVQPLGVVADHPRGEDLGPEGAQGVAEHLQPALRQAVLVGVVEDRGDPLLDEVVERRRLDVVAAIGVLDAVGRGDRPAVLAVEPLVPPAVEDGEVERSVEGRIHARGAAGLERAKGVVQPHVAPRVEVPGHGDVVVRQEDDAVADLGVVGEAHHLLDELLARLVGRVGLAGDDELHRPLGVVQQRLEPLGVAEHEGEALVGRHASGEADGQHVRVEDRLGPAQLGLRGAAVAPAVAQPASGLGHEVGAQLALGRPHLAAGDGADLVPLLGDVEVAAAEVLAGQPEDPVVDPGGGVHAVGDRGDRHLDLVEARPQPVEHLPADHAVELGDAVGAAGDAQAHDRHVEDPARAALVGLGPELQQPLGRDAGQLLRTTEVELDQRGVEAVDARRHRGVGGEDGPGPRRLERLVEAHALLGQLADPLDAEEAGVPLVGVVDLRLGRPGEARPGTQRPDPADAEEQLLLETLLAAAAVEAVGHLAHRVVVAGHVGVEEEQRHPPHLGPPDVRVQRVLAGHVDGDEQRAAVGLGDERQRQTVRVEHRVVLTLPPVRAEGLLEVAGLVEQAHPDDRHPEVARRLEVVTREDAQAAGVLRQHLGDAVLRAEVGDARRRLCAPVGVLLVPAARLEVVVEIGLGRADPGDEGLVGRQLVQLGGAQLGEQPDRVLPGRGPPVRVDPGEELTGGGVPAPPEVGSQLAECCDRLGQDGADAEASDGLHPHRLVAPPPHPPSRRELAAPFADPRGASDERSTALAAPFADPRGASDERLPRPPVPPSPDVGPSGATRVRSATGHNHRRAKGVRRPAGQVASSG